MAPRNETYIIQMGDYYFTGEIDKWQGRPVFSDEIRDARRFKTDAALKAFVEAHFPKNVIYDCAVIFDSPPQLMLLNSEGDLDEAPETPERWRLWA